MLNTKDCIKYEIKVFDFILEWYNKFMAKIKLDLHDIYSNGQAIEKDDKNFGRIFVHFRF